MSRILVLILIITLFFPFQVFAEPIDEALIESPKADSTEGIVADEEAEETETHEIEAEEYAVYSALIKEFFLTDREDGEIIMLDIKPGIERIVIDEDTQPYTGEFGEAKQTFGKELVYGYLAKNGRSHRFESRFTLDVDCVLISSEDTEEIFKDSDGWNNFYEKYPKSQGITTFSRVGFNADRTEALLYVSTQRGWLNAEGQYVQLSKKNDRWITKEKLELWLS